jgi:hypothetical protein
MPIHQRKDKKGYYYQWGDSGHKYYYHGNTKKEHAIAERRARGKAVRQMEAAFANGYRGD